MKKKYIYTHVRTCKLCGEQKTLQGKKPRSELCVPCRTKKVGVRTGTGRTEVFNKYGYQLLTVNKRSVLAHRYIMEVYLGRKLLSTEHVHHKDGNKRNNAIENLEVLTASEHQKQHWTPEHAKKMSQLGHAARWKKGS